MPFSARWYEELSGSAGKSAKSCMMESCVYEVVPVLPDP